MLAHRILGGCSSSVSVSCLSFGSELLAELMPISGSPLGGALPSVGKQGRNPLSSCTPKQWSLVSYAGADFFPNYLPDNCGALAPVRLCSRSQPQSPPWDLTSEARASDPSPRPPQQVRRQASQAGECWPAPILFAGISVLCPLQPCCCALLHGSKASPPRPIPVFASEGAS